MIHYPTPYYALALCSGIFWTLTYLLIIKRGFQDKSHGMPMFALALNISWEFIYSFVTPSPVPQRYINMVWFAFDVVILYHFLRAWRVDFKMKERWFYPLFGLVMTTCFLIVLFTQFDSVPIEQYPLGMGRAYSAFGMNLVMSIAYVFMIYSRNSVEGQSLYIALFKMLGTVFADLPFLVYAGMAGVPARDSFLFPFLYVSILVWDIIYVVQVYRTSRELGINPWTRF